MAIQEKNGLGTLEIKELAQLLEKVNSMYLLKFVACIFQNNFFDNF